MSDLDAPTIADLRREIDNVDGELVHLIQQRADLAQQIGRLKRKLELPVHDTTREAAVLERVRRRATGGALPVEEVEELFVQLMHACLELQMEDEE